MFFHVILTTACNLECRYCFGEASDDFDNSTNETDIDYSLPKTINYDVDCLSRFCSQDPDCVVTFYGGEPFLNIKDMRRVMDNVKAKHFIVQTNATYLNQLESEYLNKFHTILVSIDGDEELTDFYRGHGTFRRVVENLKVAKLNGFNGELIARMTVMEKTDIYKQVRWLLENDEFSFSSVHWQLNAGFWENDFARRNFKRWSQENYNPGIRKLVDFWVDEMENDGTVLRLYPFLGITNSILSNEAESKLRCGGGWINYAIQTDGNIIICPTMWGMRKHYLGNIHDTSPLLLRRVNFHEPCTECDIHGVCGGRCLYANITRRWSREAYALVCNTVRYLTDSINGQMPRIRKLIDTGKVAQSAFEFMKYNGCEIIP